MFFSLCVDLFSEVYGDFEYEAYDSSIKIIKYIGYEKNVFIPDSIYGKPVTIIGKDAFRSYNWITNIFIPNSVELIDDYAFYSCYNLKSVTIGNGVKQIGSDAFNYCYSLTRINIPDSVEIIGDRAFYYCTNSSSITIGNRVNQIGKWAFSDCESLIMVNIPDSVEVIDEYAFSSCDNLKSVTNGNGVKRIEDMAFYGCINLTNINIPDSVELIDDNAFYNCTNLTSLTIGNGMKQIGDMAFCRCINLEKVLFKGNAPQVDAWAFYNCPAIIYYLEGTTGWGPFFGERPTAVWRLPSLIPMYNYTSGIFRIKIAGMTNSLIGIEARTNLRTGNWNQIHMTNLVNGTIEFYDPDGRNSSTRFYRVVNY